MAEKPFLFYCLNEIGNGCIGPFVKGPKQKLPVKQSIVFIVGAGV
jgi:hypothetical protein